MRHMSTKAEAFAFAESKSRRTGSDYRIVEVKGRFAVGTIKKVDLFYPDALGWNIRYQY